MIPAKATLINLVSHSPWSARENPPQDLGYPVNPWNVDEGQGSQTGARKLVRAVTPRTEFQNMKYTNHQYKTKVFHFLQQMLGITAGYGSTEDPCVDMGMFMSSSMKAAIHLGPNYLANLEVFKNPNFEEIQILFNITQKLILQHSEEILNVRTIDSTSPSWTVDIVS